MKNTGNIIKLIASLPKLILWFMIIAGFVLTAVGIYRAGSSVREILWENKALRQALTNLSHTDKIGYAKVISQEKNQAGKVLNTTLKFVETAADDPMRKVLEKEFTVTGDIVYFDALIVKFDNQIVMDGQKKSMYIWRRIYCEEISPSQGFEIETPGTTPARYRDLLAELPLSLQNDFWQAIWELANNREMLKDRGIEAIYGTTNYMKLIPGQIYTFKISATGQISPEVIPEL